MKVIKIGGSLITNSDKFKLVTDFINKSDSKQHIVISAFGKTSSKLSECIEYALINEFESSKRILNEIKEFHLGLDTSSVKIIDEVFTILNKELQAVSLLQECNTQIYDSILSRGEELAAKFLINNLDPKLLIEFVDAKEFIICDNDGNPMINKIKKHKRISESSSANVFVTQGFVGVNESNHVITMGFESSTLSALILAIFHGTNELNIFNDVAGIRQLDPKKVKDYPDLIRNLNYEDAREASKAGIKLLPKNLIEYASNYNVVLKFGSLIKDDHSFISDEKSDDKTLIVVGNSKISLINSDLSKISEIIKMKGIEDLNANRKKSTVVISINNEFELDEFHLFFRSK